MSATSQRRHYVCDEIFSGDGPCPRCYPNGDDLRVRDRRERIMLATSLRGAARGLGVGWLWLERAADSLDGGRL